MKSAAASATEYLAELPPHRRSDIGRVRDVVLANLPSGYQESMQFGMLGYAVPLSRYPDTYNGAPLLYAALASQKNAMSLYLSCVYADPVRTERFQAAYRTTGKRLDMGKSCVRFRTADDLPLDVIAETIASTPVDEFIRIYEASRRKARD